MTIKEVSKNYDITADTLRYYERIGLVPMVARTSGGIRSYTENDCGWIEFVKCMRSAGLPINVLIKYLALYQQGESTISARKSLLVEQRSKLMGKMIDMQKTLDRLDYKIDNYVTMVPLEDNKLVNNKE